MLDFKQVKKQMTNVKVGHVDKLSLADPLALQNIASKFYKILPRITTKALVLFFFSLNILFYYGIKEQDIMSHAKYETIMPPVSTGEKRKRKLNSLYQQCKHMKPFRAENFETVQGTVTSNTKIGCKTSFNLCLVWSTKK